MACVKLGSKADGFQRQGQAWFCTSGLPSDIRLEVGEMSFHLHKFPLLSRSARIKRLIEELSEDEDEGCVIKLDDIPGGPNAFELAAKFCYGVKAELTAANVVPLRCAAEYLEMTEEQGEGNLISVTELFLNQKVFRSWKESIKALQSCDDVLPFAEDLNIVKRLIDSLAIHACSDPSLFGWPMMENGSMQSPGGSLLWNGISTGARLRHSSPDWWYEDVTGLNLQMYKRLISAMESRGIKAENIAGSLMVYAKRYLPGLNRRQGSQETSSRFSNLSLVSATNETDQKHLLETIESLLPMQKGVTSTHFLFGMLKTAMILDASPECKSNLEKRIGMQLDQATVEDLLIANYSYAVETLYDVDCIQRILDHFLSFDQSAGGASPCSIDDGHLIGSPSLTPITMVAKLMDGYLAEVAPDVNLKLPKFQSLAAALPDYARPLDDGLYRAIDIYLKTHSWLIDSEREQLCRLMDCQKLSLEACTHAAQNERLPLRVVVQVLFFEQLQLRTSIAGCFLVSDNLDTSRPMRQSMPLSNEGAVPPSGMRGENWVNAVRENQVLKVGMDNMRQRVSELEKECTTMRQEIEKLGKGKSSWSVSKKFGFRFKSQFCSTQEGAVNGQNQTSRGPEHHPKTRQSQHKRSTSRD